MGIWDWALGSWLPTALVPGCFGFFAEWTGRWRISVCHHVAAFPVKWKSKTKSFRLEPSFHLQGRNSHMCDWTFMFFQIQSKDKYLLLTTVIRCVNTVWVGADRPSLDAWDFVKFILESRSLHQIILLRYTETSSWQSFTSLTNYIKHIYSRAINRLLSGF